MILTEEDSQDYKTRVIKIKHINEMTQGEWTIGIHFSHGEDQCLMLTISEKYFQSNFPDSVKECTGKVGGVQK